MPRFINFFFSLLTAISCFSTAAPASKPIIWESPLTATSSNSLVSINKVRLFPDSTEVILNIKQPHGYWVKISSNTILRSGDASYKIKSMSPGEFDKEFWMPESNQQEFRLVFEPLPEDVLSFNFVEPLGWTINNIRPRDYDGGIADTYWRDVATGDWVIGFGNKIAVYDSRFWNITGLSEKKDAYSMTLTSGNESIPVEISKAKRNLRNIRIGNRESIKCSAITDDFLDDYPIPDSRIGFIDTGFQEGDSVTFVGWLKDMPESARKAGNEFSVSLCNILTHDQDSYSAPLDSLGRFNLKIPLLNSSEAFIDWERTNLGTLIEPGQTYFLLFDFSNNKKLFMGSDCRLQNELAKFPRHWSHQLGRFKGKKYSPEELIQLKEKADSIRSFQLEELDRLSAQHPNISQRYRDYLESGYAASMAFNLLQLRFNAADYTLPKEVIDFVNKEVWSKNYKPYTFHRDLIHFMRDLVNSHKTSISYSAAQSIVNTPRSNIRLINSLEARGKISISPEQRRAMNDVSMMFNELADSLKNLENPNDIKAIQDISSKMTLNDSTSADIFNKLISIHQPLISFYETTSILDSLSTDRALRDIYIAYELISHLDETNAPLDETRMGYFEKEVSLPVALKTVRQKNDMLIALKNRDISSEKSLTAAKDVGDMTDGELILREIVAPYKNKIIILDIWGTWCGPCRMALSNFNEHKKSLKDYDIQYIFLANHSPEEDWETVIKRFDILGDDVVHYNLPEGQQKAVENFLNVNSWPSYRLLDKNGNLLDFKMDMRNIPGLLNILKNLP